MSSKASRTAETREEPCAAPQDILTVNIENVSPELDGGRYRVKRVLGDALTVEADIFTHGHSVIEARLQYRRQGELHWHETPMRPLTNDRWTGSFSLEEIGLWEYTIFAWRDPFLSWAQDLGKKHAAKQDLKSDLVEGRRLIEHAAMQATATDRERLERIINYFEHDPSPAAAADKALRLLGHVKTKHEQQKAIADELAQLKELLLSLTGLAESLGSIKDPVREVILGDELRELMGRYPQRLEGGQYRHVLQVMVDRHAAVFGAWYEMWARSQGTEPGRSARFADMERRLEEIQRMGFSVVYLPPIHPIGKTNRKGPNNSLHCPPGSPGCPYAIGNEHGGHTAIDPELGTIEDFDRFERACRARGLELAMDFAVQASPDHPWVTEHPEWFAKRPDGSIKCAENPPKTYEDIYPIDFSTPDRHGLARELLSTLRFWMDHGVRIFRVDNPHTKPVHFWEWLIGTVQRTDPDTIFLAEAFTRPKMMKLLAKAGFTQSYTYFTWRNFKHELMDYFTELTQSEIAEYMRGNLFTNTPDILPEVLQNAPRSMFKVRAALAGTLGSVWGMYNGFELCEGRPLPGREEYLDSEKYQYKVWDWDRPGHIKDFITKLNRVRNEQPALQHYRNVRFFEADNDNVLFYGKMTPELRNIVVVAVNLDPYHVQESSVKLPLKELGLRSDETYQMHDLISDRRFYWRGEQNYVRLDPDDQPVHIMRLLRWSHREQDFDYFF